MHNATSTFGAIISLLFGLVSSVQGQNTSVNNYAASALDPQILATTDMLAELEKYKMQKLRDDFTEPDAQIVYAVSTTPVPTTHPRWGAARINTYSDAWAQVQTQFVQTQLPGIEMSLIRSMYGDASGRPPAYSPEEYTGSDAIDELIDKSSAYAEARLDQALRRVGVDPEEYERSDRKQRKELLTTTIQRETLIRAVGRLSGLWQLKTFSKTTESGYTVIGVVGVYSPHFELVGQQILQGETIVDVQKAGKPLAERLDLPDELLIEQFGTRILYDEYGKAVLVSFGHSELPRTNLHPATVSAKLSIALDDARNMASSHIAEFLNGTLNYNNRTIVGQSVREHMDVDRGGYIEQGVDVDFTNILQGMSESRAKVQLGGLSDYRTWVIPHPVTGHTMVGVMRVWTREASDAARIVRNGPTNSNISGSSNERAEPPSQKSEAWETESVEF